MKKMPIMTSQVKKIRVLFISALGVLNTATGLKKMAIL